LFRHRVLLAILALVDPAYQASHYIIDAENRHLFASLLWRFETARLEDNTSIGSPSFFLQENLFAKIVSNS